jgi:hypothetical protein
MVSRYLSANGREFLSHTSLIAARSTECVKVLIQSPRNYTHWQQQNKLLHHVHPLPSSRSYPCLDAQNNDSELGGDVHHVLE